MDSLYCITAASGAQRACCVPPGAEAASGRKNCVEIAVRGSHASPAQTRPCGGPVHGAGDALKRARCSGVAGCLPSSFRYRWQRPAQLARQTSLGYVRFPPRDKSTRCFSPPRRTGAPGITTMCFSAGRDRFGGAVVREPASRPRPLPDKCSTAPRFPQSVLGYSSRHCEVAAGNNVLSPQFHTLSTHRPAQSCG